MIPLFVFFVHIVAFAAIFTKRWQEEGTGEGLLGLVFALLIFFVGWSMASFIMKVVMQPEGFALWFDRDAAALLLLTAAEGIFYYFYLRNDHTDENPAEPRANRS
jgi:ABC-type multidrug transport system permease subunit